MWALICPSTNRKPCLAWPVDRSIAGGYPGWRSWLGRDDSLSLGVGPIARREENAREGPWRECNEARRHPGASCVCNPIAAIGWPRRAVDGLFVSIRWDSRCLPPFKHPPRLDREPSSGGTTRKSIQTPQSLHTLRGKQGCVSILRPFVVWGGLSRGSCLLRGGA